MELQKEKWYNQHFLCSTTRHFEMLSWPKTCQGQNRRVKTKFLWLFFSNKTFFVYSYAIALHRSNKTER